MRSLNARVLFVFAVVGGLMLAQGLQVIHLKDGSSVKGTVVSEGAETLYVKTDYGQLRIPKSGVLRVDYAPSVGQPMPGAETGGAKTEGAIGSLFHAKPKKEACLGCLFSWLIPGAGMLYADQPGWAAGYFLVGTPLMVWYVVEATSNQYSPDLTPLYILLPIRIAEYIHTYAAVNNYNKKYGWAYNWDQHQRTAGIEYRFSPIGTSLQPALALDLPIDRTEVKAGVKLRF